MTSIALKITAKFFELMAFMNRQKKVMLALFLLLLVFLGVYLRKTGYISPEEIFSFLAIHRVLALVLYVLIYALMIVLLIPSLPMNLGAGFLWGPFWGGAITLIAATLGASLSFFVARFIARDYLKQKFNGKAWAWLESELHKKNWKVVAFTRANPVFPFGLLSYFFGVTTISFWKYFWSTALFIFPGVFIFAALGDSIGGIILNPSHSSIIRNIFMISLLVTALVVIRFVLKAYSDISTKEEPKELQEL